MESPMHCLLSSLIFHKVHGQTWDPMWGMACFSCMEGCSWRIPSSMQLLQHALGTANVFRARHATAACQAAPSKGSRSCHQCHTDLLLSAAVKLVGALNELLRGCHCWQDLSVAAACRA